MLLSLLMAVSLHLKDPCGIDRSTFFMEVEDQAYQEQCAFRDDWVDRWNCDVILEAEAAEEIDHFCALK